MKEIIMILGVFIFLGFVSVIHEDLTRIAIAIETQSATTAGRGPKDESAGRQASPNLKWASER